MHLMFWLQRGAGGLKERRHHVCSSVESGDGDEEESEFHESWSTLQKLVYFKIDEIEKEFNDLFSDDAYEDPKRLV